MSPIFKKLIRDLRYDRTKWLLSLVAILLSVWGISTVSYGYLLTERDFRVNFDGTAPAHMILELKAPTEALIDSLKQMESIAAIEQREAFMGRVKEKKGGWMPVLVFAVADFTDLRINTFTIDEKNIPEKGEIGVEKNSAFFLGDQKSVVVQIPGLDEKVFPIRTYPHDPRLPAARMDHVVYAYMDISTYRDLGFSTDIARFLVRVKAKTPNLAILNEVATQLKGRITALKGQLQTLEIPPPNEHPHQNIVDAVSVLQLSLGGILLILGVTLLSLILLLWMLPQVPQVGIMKAIGASTAAIKSAYWSLLLIAGGIGLAVGLPLGYLTGSFFNRFIAFTQNFEPVDAPLPFYYHLAIGSICLTWPLLVGYGPISKAANTDVRTAIKKTFYSIPPIWLRLLQKIIPNVKGRYVWNGFLKNGRRATLNIGLLTLGLLLFFVGINLRYSMERDTAFYFAESTHQLSFRVLNASAEAKSSLSGMENIKKIWGIGEEGLYLKGANEASNQFLSIKLLPGGFKFPEAYWIKGTGHPDCTNCVFMNQSMAKRLKLEEVGQNLVFIDKTGKEKKYQLSGILKQLAVGPAIYRYGSQSPVSNIDELWVQVKNPTGKALEETLQAGEEKLKAMGFTIRSSGNDKRKLKMLRDHLEPTFLIIQWMGIGTTLIGLFGLGLLININLQERNAEIGILKSLGASNQQISRLLFGEVLWLNAIGMVLALLGAWWVSIQMGKLLGGTLLHIAIPFYPHWTLGILAVLVLIGLQALLWLPYLRKKLRLTAVDLVRG